MNRYLTGIIAIIIAIGAFAFTKDSKEIINGKAVDTFYYNAALGSDQTDPDNYQLTSVTCNSGSNFVCTIKAKMMVIINPYFNHEQIRYMIPGCILQLNVDK